jgi:hypothetical protein
MEHDEPAYTYPSPPFPPFPCWCYSPVCKKSPTCILSGGIAKPFQDVNKRSVVVKPETVGIGYPSRKCLRITF